MKNRHPFFIYLSLFFALFLDATYFFPSFEVIRPPLVLLTLIYWNIALPDKVGVSYSIVTGVLSDLLKGSILGTHSLLFVLISYLCQRFFYQFRVMRLFQQCLILFLIFFLVKGYWSLNSTLFGNMEVQLLTNEGLLNAFTYAFLCSLVWPLVFYLLRIYRRRWIK